MGLLLTRRHPYSALLLLLLCQTCALAAASDTPETTFHSQVSEVHLIFSAIDQNNHAIATLKPADIAVVDRDVIVRNFQSFTLSDFTSLEVVILIDASASASRRYQQEVSQAAGLLAEMAGVPDRSFTIATFSGFRSTKICQQDCRASNLAERIPPASGALTPLFDSLISAADSFSRTKDPKARRILILFSDGEDTISKNPPEAAVDHLLANDVQVYAIDFSKGPSRGSTFLRDLALSTGGRYSSEAATILQAVLDDFHASYRLTYRVPDPTPGFHAIQIYPTRNLNLNFRFRRGYQYPAAN